MALITIEGPQIRPPEYKSQLVREMTEVAARHWGIDVEDVIILIKEQGGAHMRETAGSLARGGRLLTDRSDSPL